ASRLSLGLANMCMTRFREANRWFATAREAARFAPWPDGEAACLGSLGSASLELGDLGGAEAFYRGAMLLNRRLTRPAAEATNRSNLAIVQMVRGRFSVAADNLRQVLEYQHSAHLASSEALTLYNLGAVCR